MLRGYMNFIKKYKQPIILTAEDNTLFGSAALSGKMLLIEKNKIDGYFRFQIK